MELYGHNLPTYRELCGKLMESNKCALIQATGTGKSFILMMLIGSVFKGLRVVYAVPNIAIAQSIQLYDEWQFDNVEFVTYTGLKNLSGHVDLLVLDELHRAGARLWNTYVRSAMSMADYVVGMSATPFRFLDGRRDMAKELFGDNIVYGPDIQEAVSKGILPGFDYVAILSESRVEIDYSILKKTDPVRCKGLRLDEYNLSERIKKYIRPEHRKIIVFYPDSAALEQSDIDLRNWFGDVNIYSLYSKQSKVVNKKNLDGFNRCSNRCILRAVDMVNEGMHLKGVSVAVFARKTVSGNVFIQQIGRILSASNKKVRPVIIDLVENYKNIRVLSTTFRESAKTKVRGSSLYKEQPNATEVLISYDDVLLDLEDVMSKITDKWTEEEDNVLRKYYPVEGKRCYIRLEGKTERECIKRVRLLGIEHTKLWSSEEDDILRRYYPSDKDSVWKRLPGRTQSAINRRADKLGLIPKWTAEEDLLLMLHWESMGLDMHPMLPRHGFVEIVNRAKKLGLKSNKNDPV